MSVNTAESVGIAPMFLAGVPPEAPAVHEHEAPNGLLENVVWQFMAAVEYTVPDAGQPAVEFEPRHVR